MGNIRRGFVTALAAIGLPVTVAAQAPASLEVAADSAGVPIVVNGRQLGLTAMAPVLLSVPSGNGVRVEVGRGSRARAVSLDLPAGGRVRLDVTIPKDTQPVPAQRQIADIERELNFASRYAPLVEPIAPVRPKAPTIGKSVFGGILLGAATAGIGVLACDQKFTSPGPNGGYVNGQYYAPGSHSLGLAPSCLAGLGGGGLLAGTISIHQLRRGRFRSVTAGFEQAEAQHRIALTRYRAEMLRQEEVRSTTIAQAQTEDEARRRAVVASNETILRGNRELPVVTFIDAPGARASGARTSLLPPALLIASIAFADTDGDSIISAGERATLTVRLRNNGKGTAYDVRLDAKASGSGVRTVPIEVGSIPPGAEREHRLDLSAAQDIADGLASIEVSALEANGFDAAPFLVRVATLAYRAPDLAVIDVGIEDPEGRSVIRPGVVVQVKVRVQNRGEGPADDVKVVIARGDPNLLFITDVSQNTLVLDVGRMRAGERRDVEVEVMANQRATGFPLRASVIEATGRYGVAPRDLGLQLQVQQRRLGQLDVVGRGPVVASGAAMSSLGSDLLKDIPTSSTRNPYAFAVIIGNRNYRGDTPPVEFAANDAAVTRQYAIQALGIPEGNVLMLEDATLTDLKVMFGDRGNPRGRLQRLIARADSTDIFVFYSGHGAPDPTERQAYLVPVDGDADQLALSAYSLDLLYDNLAALGVRHTTVVLDACFSGAASGGSGAMLINSASPLGIVVRDPAARFAEGRATVIAAAEGQQLANWYPEQRHGLLTYFFLKGLQGSADADGDGAVSVREMQVWLTNPSAGLAYEARRLFNRTQTPQVFGAGDKVLRP